jgi:4a-hydroxytetrahydrobiopterin dehydratase
MNLLERHCIHGAPALDPQAIPALLAQVPGWQAIDGTIARDYSFADYRATIAFVNAVAAMAEQQNHHPELTVGYRRCTVAYTTHSAGGALSENDFICAARIDALYAQGTGA